MNTGRAVFGMAVHISNGVYLLHNFYHTKGYGAINILFSFTIDNCQLGLVKGKTSPGGLISTPRNGRFDDEVDDLKLPTDTDQTAVSATLEIVDIEMSAIEDADKNSTSEADPLADFLPPPSTEKCSNELQVC